MTTTEFKADDKVRNIKTAQVGTVFGVHKEDRCLHVHTNNEISNAEDTALVWRAEDVELLDAEEHRIVMNFVLAKRRKTDLNKQVKEASAEYGRAEDAVLEYFERMAAQGTKRYAGLGQVAIVGMDVHPSITEENKEAAFAEIEAMGRGEIIKRAVHPSTLESFVAELIDSGVKVPAHIGYYMKPKLSVTGGRGK